MKFKSLLLVVSFTPAMVMAQGAPKIEAPVAPKTPSAGMPGANGGGVKPAPSVAVNPPPRPATAPQPQVGSIAIPASVQSTKPPQQVGGANTQLGDGRTLQSGGQPNEQVVGSPLSKAKSKVDVAIAGTPQINDYVNQAKAKAKQHISTQDIDKKDVVKKINQTKP